jgi:hypothetical protein
VLENSRVNGNVKGNSSQEIIYGEKVNIYRVFVNLFRFNRTNWKAVSGCLLAAVVFWLFNALNKNYSTNVRFPLQFDFDKSKYVPAQALPRDIYLNVTGNGWDLFRKALGVKIPALVVPLERPADVKKIVGSTMPPLLAVQLGNLKINHVVTDTLYLAIEQKDSARFKLVIDSSPISYRAGYGRISPIVVLPDSVEIEGPKSAFRNFADSLVLMLPEKRLSGNFREEVEVRLPGNGFLKRNPPVVEVIFEVGEVIQQEKKLKLELRHVKPNTSLKEDSDSIVCTIQVPAARQIEFRGIASVKAVIDVRELKKGQAKVLPLIIGLPEYAKIVKVDSVSLKMY